MNKISKLIIYEYIALIQMKPRITDEEAEAINFVLNLLIRLLSEIIDDQLDIDELISFLENIDKKP